VSARDKTEYISATEFRDMRRQGSRETGPATKKITEGDILRAVRDFLRLHGWKVTRIHQSLGSERGIPDLVVIREGRTIWIECKTPTGRLSEYQERWLQDLEDHGGHYIVARSVEDVEHLCRRK
jgi:hypothetical protein